MRFEYEEMAKEYEDYKRKQEFKDNLHLSTDYIDWMEEFTKSYKVFATDSFLYDKDKIEDKDKKNIELLEGLFEAIAEFADKNYITPKRSDYQIYYLLKHNNIGYKIGMDYGQGASFYCDRLDKPEKDSIEYKNIMSGVKLPKTIQAEYKLEELKNYIERLVEEDVPVEAIHRATDAVIQKVKVKRK